MSESKLCYPTSACLCRGRMETITACLFFLRRSPGVEIMVLMNVFKPLSLAVHGAKEPTASAGEEDMGGFFFLWVCLSPQEDVFHLSAAHKPMINYKKSYIFYFH